MGSGSHDLYGCHARAYTVKILKISNWMTDDLETWCASFWTLPSLFRWRPFVDHDLFYFSVKVCHFVFCMEKGNIEDFSDSIVHQSWYICNQLNKLLNTSGQGHLLTLVLGPSDLVLLNSLKQMETKLHTKHQWDEEVKVWGIWVTWPRWLTGPYRCIVKWILNSSSQELKDLGMIFVQMMTLVDLDLYENWS